MLLRPVGDGWGGTKIGRPRAHGSSGDWYAARLGVWERRSTRTITHLGSSTAPVQDEVRRYYERRRGGRSFLIELWSEHRPYRQDLTKVAQSRASRTFRWIEGALLLALSVLLIAVTVRSVPRSEL